MELRQACTGFANSLMIACGMLSTAGEDTGINTVAIAGSETGSVYFDMQPAFLNDEQLLNFMQMGDGAGAVILRSATANDSREIISDSYMEHCGLDKPPGFYMQGGGSAEPVCEHGIPLFKHDGHAVRAHGTELFLKALKRLKSAAIA
ncbi:MAG: 3-oxoacyl-[acyl-carrier-protein] synthase-3 [Lentisphaeria bacterium]|jgi:3-oxoacyl-[acyl-carrier-protein] synthase-3